MLLLSRDSFCSIFLDFVAVRSIMLEQLQVRSSFRFFYFGPHGNIQYLKNKSPSSFNVLVFIIHIKLRMSTPKKQIDLEALLLP